MEFLIALFGSIWLASVLFKEKSASLRYENHMADYREKRAWLEERYGTTREHEKEIEDLLLDRSRREEVYKMLEPDLIAIFGPNYRDFFVLEQYREKHFLLPSGNFDRTSNLYRAKQLLLSHECKLQWFDRPTIWTGNLMDCDLNLKFIQQMEKNFQSRGEKDFRLVLTVPLIPRARGINTGYSRLSLTPDYLTMDGKNDPSRRLWQ